MDKECNLLKCREHFELLHMKISVKHLNGQCDDKCVSSLKFVGFYDDHGEELILAVE